MPKLPEALDLAQKDNITRKPFLYDATINWEQPDKKRGWLAVFWLKATDPSERYLFPQLILQINKDGKPRRFEIAALQSWAVPWGYFWKRQVQFTVVPGEGVEQSLDKEANSVELKIGEQELVHEMFVGIHDADGGETDKVKVRTIQWWTR